MVIEKENHIIAGSAGRKIPVVMATQHPDNAGIPYWHKTEFISTMDEVEECYRSFCDMGCDEYMWDWEGKFVDEAVLDRLFHQYYDYFKINHLGSSKFLTFRIPNIWEEPGFRIARAFMAIITGTDAAGELGFSHAPVFEVILPMTDNAEKLIHIQEQYYKTVRLTCQVFSTRLSGPVEINIIPLIEGSGSLIKSRSILLEYIDRFENRFKHRVEYIRPFIARSDPALNSGMVPAVIAAKGAISEYYRFQNETGIPVYPIIGAGSLQFRGGLSPDTIENFMDEYTGVRTVTVQSAFRYDFPREVSASAIRLLKRDIPLKTPRIFSDGEMKDILELEDTFRKPYCQTVERLASTLNDIARHIPSHRERIQHTGLFGYSRGITDSNIRLPRAIAFTAAFYSLGIPPELIGTGRGIHEADKKGLLSRLESIYPNLKKDMRIAGCFLNKENLRMLSASDETWKDIITDVGILEDYIGSGFAPTCTEHFLHRNHVSNILHMWRDGREFRREILSAGIIRRSLG
jgi:phosphoenolpyruvate carboxylase